MPRVRKNADQRRQEILNAALSLFMQKGFQNVVIGEIAETAGVARTTFYEYYTSKEQILVELVGQVANEIHEIIPQGNNCREKLEDAARSILKQIYENQRVYNLIFREAPVLSAIVSENLVKWRRAGFVQIKKIIDEGENDLNTDIDRADAAYAFHALLGQRAGDILLTGEAPNIAEESKRLVNVLWSGLARR